MITSDGVQNVDLSVAEAGVHWDSARSKHGMRNKIVFGKYGVNQDMSAKTAVLPVALAI